MKLSQNNKEISLGIYRALQSECYIKNKKIVDTKLNLDYISIPVRDDLMYVIDVKNQGNIKSLTIEEFIEFITEVMS